jgi:hypothetical protein
MEYYSVIENNELLLHTVTCMNIENIILSERSQSQKATYSSIFMKCSGDQHQAGGQAMVGE